jgi:hypothetical protein
MDFENEEVFGAANWVITFSAGCLAASCNRCRMLSRHEYRKGAQPGGDSDQ